MNTLSKPTLHVFRPMALKKIKKKPAGRRSTTRPGLGGRPDPEEGARSRCPAIGGREPFVTAGSNERSRSSLMGELSCPRLVRQPGEHPLDELLRDYPLVGIRDHTAMWLRGIVHDRWRDLDEEITLAHR
jgi:hypothetical protein